MTMLSRVGGGMGIGLYPQNFVELRSIMVPSKVQYVIVTIGNIIHRNNTTCIKCYICGVICEGETQQEQIKILFKCLERHIPAEHLYETYEIEGSRVVTEMNKDAWDKAKKSTKYRK